MRSRKISSFSDFIKCSSWIFKGTASNFSKFEAVPLKIHRAEQGFALKIRTFSARNARTYFYEKTLILGINFPRVQKLLERSSTDLIHFIDLFKIFHSTFIKKGEEGKLFFCEFESIESVPRTVFLYKNTLSK